MKPVEKKISLEDDLFIRGKIKVWGRETELGGSGGRSSWGIVREPRTRKGIESAGRCVTKFAAHGSVLVAN